MSKVMENFKELIGKRCSVYELYNLISRVPGADCTGMFAQMNKNGVIKGRVSAFDFYHVVDGVEKVLKVDYMAESNPTEVGLLFTSVTVQGIYATT